MIKLFRGKEFNYYVYKIRLETALKGGFHLEAVFIEYAIIEDRAKSILKVEGKWGELKSRRKNPSFIMLKEKLDGICELVREKDKYASSYFKPEILKQIEDIRTWVGKRNDLVHELMDRPIDPADFENTAKEGKKLSDRLSDQASGYKRYLKDIMKKSGDASEHVSFN